MKTSDKSTLFKKYSEGSCTTEEIQLLESWFAQWNMVDHVQLNEMDLIQAESLMRPVVMDRIRLKQHRLWPLFTAAASIILLACAAIYFSYPKLLGPEGKARPALVHQVIRAGKLGATLTLADGRQIVLAASGDIQLVREAGITIRKSPGGRLIYDHAKNGTAGETGRDGVSGAMNTLATARGETYQVRLPDGSSVWLNASSSLTYPVNLMAGKQRKVLLSGEGYFEIAKDSQHPFIVETLASAGKPGQSVRVLGTHFNISSYPEEAETRTTLFEGSIKLSVPSGKERLLTPGQQASVDNDKIQVSEADLDEALAWKDGLFYFNKADIRYVMNQFSRWYDVKIDYQGSVPMDRITGKVHRSADLTSALQILKYLDIHYSVQGRTITIKP